MADTASTARTDLATAITEILVELHPGDLSGDEIVDRLCAHEKGAEALTALGRELTNERFRESCRQLGDSLRQVGRALGMKIPEPEPVDDEPSTPGPETEDTRRAQGVKSYVEDRMGPRLDTKMGPPTEAG